MQPECPTEKLGPLSHGKEADAIGFIGCNCVEALSVIMDFQDDVVWIASAKGLSKGEASGKLMAKAD